MNIINISNDNNDGEKDNKNDDNHNDNINNDNDKHENDIDDDNKIMMVRENLTERKTKQNQKNWVSVIYYWTHHNLFCFVRNTFSILLII